MPNYVNIQDALYLGISVPTQPQQSFGNVSTLIMPVFTNVRVPTTSSIFGMFNYWAGTGLLSQSVDVSDYNNHTFQAALTSSGSNAFTNSIVVQSSNDGVNFVTENTFTLATTTSTSSFFRLSNRRRYFVCSLSGSAGSTSSLYLVSGQ